MNNLRVCPFCGGVPHIKRDMHTIATWDGYEIVNCYVECWNCEARGGAIQYKREIGKAWVTEKTNANVDAEVEEKAAEKWNLRAETAIP